MTTQFLRRHSGARKREPGISRFGFDAAHRPGTTHWIRMNHDNYDDNYIRGILTA